PPLPPPFPYTTLFRFLPARGERLPLRQTLGRRQGEEPACEVVHVALQPFLNGLQRQHGPSRLRPSGKDQQRLAGKRVCRAVAMPDRKSTRLNSSHLGIS